MEASVTSQLTFVLALNIVKRASSQITSGRREFYASPPARRRYSSASSACSGATLYRTRAARPHLSAATVVWIWESGPRLRPVPLRKRRIWHSKNLATLSGTRAVAQQIGQCRRALPFKRPVPPQAGQVRSTMPMHLHMGSSMACARSARKGRGIRAAIFRTISSSFTCASLRRRERRRGLCGSRIPRAPLSVSVRASSGPPASERRLRAAFLWRPCRASA